MAMSMYFTNNADIRYVASAFEENVHVDFEQKVWDDENRAAYKTRIGYLTLTVEEAETLAKDLLAAAEKARDYDPDAPDEDEDEDGDA
jgi:hypothetical protein